MGLPHEQVGLYVRSQCLPFIEAGCSSWGETSMSMWTMSAFPHYFSSRPPLDCKYDAMTQMLPRLPREMQAAGEIECLNPNLKLDKNANAHLLLYAMVSWYPLSIFCP